VPTRETTRRRGGIVVQAVGLSRPRLSQSLVSKTLPRELLGVVFFERLNPRIRLAVASDDIRHIRIDIRVEIT
jgi:hypothetical protein